jgi:hypothetical protein
MSSSLSLGQWISEKLSWDNFLLWRVQVVPIVCDAQLFGYLDDTIARVGEDSFYSHIMGCSRSASPGFINVSLPQEVIGHVATCVTAAEVWKEINAMFAS